MDQKSSKYVNTFNKWFAQMQRVKNYSAVFITLIVSSFLLSILSYAFPWYFSLIIDNLLTRNDSLVYAVILLSLLTSLFMIVLTFFRSYLQTWLHNKLVLGLRKEYYLYVLQLPIQFFTEFPTGKLSQRIFEDIELICGTVVSTIINIFVEVVKLLIIIIILSIAGVKFLVLFGLMACLYLMNLSVFKKSIENTSRAVGTKTGELYSKLYDTLPGIKEIKNFSTEKTESRIFVRENCSLFRLRIKSFVIASSMNMIAESIPAIGAFFAFIFTVNEYIQGNISLGFLVLIMSYLQMLRGPIEVLVGVATSLRQGVPAIDRIEEITTKKTEKYLTNNNTTSSDFIKFIFVPCIEFRNVTFSYPNSNSKQVIKNITLNIKSGQSVALVGHTGAGKTTITALILKYYLPSSGEIFISGKNIENYAVNELRKYIAVVPQHPHMFYTTIENNIKYGEPVSREIVIAVCKKIKLHDFIISLPEGYDSILGERGVKLSGGQKQLVAIARAMVKNLPILILDEATSSLDSQTESIIKDALNQLIQNRTTIAIAHRLSTIINSDEIIVLEGGAIKERGKHNELLENNGTYSNLYKEQFKKEYIKNVL